jgi:hypothetical protein
MLTGFIEWVHVRCASISNSYQELGSTINQSDTQILGFPWKAGVRELSQMLLIIEFWIVLNFICNRVVIKIKFLWPLWHELGGGRFGCPATIVLEFCYQQVSFFVWIGTGEWVFGKDSKVVSSSDPPWSCCVEMSGEWVKFLLSSSTWMPMRHAYLYLIWPLQWPHSPYLHW